MVYCGVADSLGPGRDIPEADWRRITKLIPIACVDVLPVLRNLTGAIASVGLIQRPLEERLVWTHVGGRVGIGETLVDGARRHLRENLGAEGDLHQIPFFVNQYFQDRRAGFGWDPNKHAIAVCYVSDFDPAVKIVCNGEAQQFHWFGPEELPRPDEFWPGAYEMVRQLLMETGTDS